MGESRGSDAVGRGKTVAIPSRLSRVSLRLRAVLCWFSRGWFCGDLTAVFAASGEPDADNASGAQREEANKGGSAQGAHEDGDELEQSQGRRAEDSAEDFDQGADDAQGRSPVQRLLDGVRGPMSMTSLGWVLTLRGRIRVGWGW